MALSNAERQRLYRQRRAEAAGGFAPSPAPVTTALRADEPVSRNDADLAARPVAGEHPDDGRQAINDTENVPPIVTTGGVPEASPDLGTPPIPVTADPPAVRYVAAAGALQQIDVPLGNDRHTAAPARRGDDAPGGAADVTVTLHPAELARLDGWRACQPDQPDRAAAVRLLVLGALRIPAGV